MINYTWIILLFIMVIVLLAIIGLKVRGKKTPLDGIEEEMGAIADEEEVLEDEGFEEMDDKPDDPEDIVEEFEDDLDTGFDDEATDESISDDEK